MPESVPEVFLQIERAVLASGKKILISELLHTHADRCQLWRVLRDGGDKVFTKTYIALLSSKTPRIVRSYFPGRSGTPLYIKHPTTIGHRYARPRLIQH
jgi:hypothetical protein